MAEQQFVDQGDWLDAIMALVFVVIFSACISALWLESRDLVPLSIILPFTAFFLLAMPFLMKQFLVARTREFRVNCESEEIILVIKRPFQNSIERIPLKSVSKLIFQTTNNDGDWHQAKIEFCSKRRLSFAQGGHEQTVRAEYDRMIAAIRTVTPDVPTQQVRD